MIRQELKLALMNGGSSIGQHWQELSLMHIYRRLDLLKQGRFGSWRPGSAGKTDKGRHRRTRLTLKSRLGHKRQSGQENMMNRWPGGRQGRNLRNRNPMGGKLIGSIRYRVRKDVLQIGAINPSSARSLQAVQTGARGSSVHRPELTGDQPVTPKMRRLFWMAGIPLKKETTRLRQPERPLIYPAFRKLEPKFLPYIEEHIKKYLSQPAGALAPNVKRGKSPSKNPTG